MDSTINIDWILPTKVQQKEEIIKNDSTSPSLENIFPFAILTKSITIFTFTQFCILNITGIVATTETSSTAFAVDFCLLFRTLLLQYVYCIQLSPAHQYLLRVVVLKNVRLESISSVSKYYGGELDLL